MVFGAMKNIAAEVAPSTQPRFRPSLQSKGWEGVEFGAM